MTSMPDDSFAATPVDSQTLELLAPAGDAAALEAAIAAGADAVYLGLRALNARRRAANFDQEGFLAAVEGAHRRGVRVYLTVNTDIAERELGQAARILELAARHGVDAVLVRDPALLVLAEHFPALPLHFSTQNCVTNSAEVQAAAKLGARRVVLAREMSLAEITAASAVGVETEVFVQGALCFSVSGRCLVSSWVGGRSGNRGGCTSPCRVPWNADDGPLGTPLSMRDLSAVARLDALRAAGVAAIKIEGRMKNAEWVGRSVELYRRALDAGDDAAAQSLIEAAAALGAYTGREMTCGYLDDKREALTGQAAGRGRQPDGTPARSESAEEEPPVAGDVLEGNVAEEGATANELPGEDPVAAEDDRWEPASDGIEGPASAEDATARQRSGPRYDFHVRVEPKGVVFRFRANDYETQWTLPRTVVRRPEKAVALANLLALLELERFEGFALGEASAEPPDFLLVPRAFNEVLRRIGAAVRLARKGPSDTVRLALSAEIRETLLKPDPHPLNKLTLGSRADRVRIAAADVGRFLREIESVELIVEGVNAEGLKALVRSMAGLPLIVALPAVFFEDEVPGVRRLLAQCRQARIGVEVNSIGGWLLAREARVRMEGGPGLAVLNSLAARKLTAMGLRSVMLSPEADRRQLEELCEACPALLSLTVFGRPPLMTSRVALPRESFEGRVLADRRGLRMIPRRERGLWVFRPEEAFDLRNVTNERIHVRHLVVDLVGSPDPIDDWRDVPLPEWRRFRFNYDRTLA